MRNVYGLVTAAALVTAVVLQAQSEPSPGPTPAPTPAITDAKLGTRLTGFKTEAAAGVVCHRDHARLARPQRLRAIVGDAHVGVARACRARGVQRQGRQRPHLRIEGGLGRLRLRRRARGLSAAFEQTERTACERPEQFPSPHAGACHTAPVPDPQPPVPRAPELHVTPAARSLISCGRRAAGSRSLQHTLQFPYVRISPEG